MEGEFFFSFPVPPGLVNAVVMVGGPRGAREAVSWKH